MNNQQQIIDSFGNMLIQINSNLTQLLQLQQISNFLALANNPKVPENIQADYLGQAMSLMGIERQKDSTVDDLPSNVFKH